MATMRKSSTMRLMLVALMIVALAAAFILPGLMANAKTTEVGFPTKVIGSTVSNANPYNEPNLVTDPGDSEFDQAAWDNYGIDPRTPVVIAFDMDVEEELEAANFTLFKVDENGDPLDENSPENVYIYFTATFGYLQTNEIALSTDYDDVTGYFFEANTLYKLECSVEGWSVIFKVKQPGPGGGGGGGNNPVYNLGGIVWAWHDADIEPVDSVPYYQRLLYAFTNNIPAVTNANYDNKNAIFVWAGIPDPLNPSTPLVEGVDYKVVFEYAGNRWWVAIIPLDGDVLDPQPGYWASDTYTVTFTSDLKANNGNPLQNPFTQTFHTFTIQPK